MEAIAFLKQRDNARKEEIELLMQMQNSSGRHVYHFDAFEVKFHEHYFKEYYFNIYFFRDWNHLLMEDVLLSLATELQIMDHQEGQIRLFYETIRL